MISPFSAYVVFGARFLVDWADLVSLRRLLFGDMSRVAKIPAPPGSIFRFPKKWGPNAKGPDGAPLIPDPDDRTQLRLAIFGFYLFALICYS